MLPNFVIAGFPKCGTTSLFTWLADHPQVVGSTVKETNYFVDPGTHSFRTHANFRDHGLAGYEAFFPAETDAKVILEATPQYAYQTTALTELPLIPSRPKIIFVLRNPADQIFSLYKYYKGNFNFVDRDMSFSKFVELARSQNPAVSRNELLINAFANCDYELHLKRWMQNIGQDRISIYIFEDMKRDRKHFVQCVAREMGIDSCFYNTYSFPVENYSYRLRSYHLHQLNIRVRNMLPISQRSSLWRGLRSVYRKLNTRPHDKEMPNRDQDVLQALRDEWSSRYNALVHRYGLLRNAPANTIIGTRCHDLGVCR